MAFMDFDKLLHLLLAKVLQFGNSLALAAAVFVAVVAAGSVVAAALRGAARRQPTHAPLLSILARAAWMAGLVLAIISALQNLGVDVTAFVASIGLAGITLGFALRDIVSSFVAGLLILFYHPFRPGDRIVVQGVEGRVLAIDLRYTTLAGEDRVHLVPNSLIITNTVSVMREPPSE